MSMLGDLADNIAPPTDENGAVLTVSTTARSYTLETAPLGRAVAPGPLTTNQDRVYVRVHAVTANVFVQFKSSATVTLDMTYAQSEAGSEGTAITFSNKFGELIEAGQFRDFTLNRGKHRFLHVQGSAAGTCRFRASSDPLPGR